jgi:hypothetical protein
MWGKRWKEVEQEARPSFMDDFLACMSSARLVISLMSGFVFFQLHSFDWLHIVFFAIGTYGC